MSARKARAAAIVKAMHGRIYLRTRRPSATTGMQPWQLKMLMAMRTRPFPQQQFLISWPRLTGRDWMRENLRRLITPDTRRSPAFVGIDPAPGADRAVNIVYLAGDAEQLKFDDNERRFWIITDEVQP